MPFKICASVTATTKTKLVEMVSQSEQMGADLIEIRIDYLQEPVNLKMMRELTPLPLIATNRTKDEGGFTQDEEEVRIACLLQAAHEGFEYVDLELRTPQIKQITSQFKAETGTQLIISHHDFSSSPTPSSLNDLLHAELAVGADICKIITTANTMTDNLTCLEFVDKTSPRTNVICFCVGKKGIPSRILSPLFGGYMTYAAVVKGKEAASGQLTIKETKNFYEML